MGFRQWLSEIKEKIKSGKLSELSIGRVSIEQPELFRSLDVRYRFLNPRYPREWLTLIEKAVMLNPDLSQMHELIVDLANTGHRVEIEPENKALSLEINSLAEALNADSLINQLFSQLVLYGAVSIEVVVDERLKGIKDIVRVSPVTVFFLWNEEQSQYEPYQWIGTKEPVKLNPYTYVYIPLLTIDGSPYGIPPFLSALSAIEVQEEVRGQLKGLAQKLGLLGFLDLKIPLPSRAPSETDTEYLQRCNGQLEELAKAIVENIQKGVLLHYEGSEAEFKEVGANASGVREIIELNEQWIISGAKGQPSLLGRTSGSTETWATVAYEQFVRMLQNYQRVIRRAMEYCYKLHALLLGYEFDDINVVFNPIKSLRPDKDAEVLKTKAEAVVMLLQSNLIEKEEAKKVIEEVLKR
ncbi:phage portal protein family protein [Thermodesulfovibrio yellowstonii]|uniref:phage portal protein family protein n=1 Tax=Thermodesulfovibrio yellowstonii TaxID=28262 RepID=UPI0024B3694F|nr:hypothetical protein [Thermodesulfovibrio yellowstonii]MDI6865777.1 hypothetical protein [Thermodesulfovibrio yellowstonii]